MVADPFVGRGGQQLLLEREPFCPNRDCQRACAPDDCTCRPCSCHACRLRRLKARRAPAQPLADLPRRDWSVQPRLFADQIPIRPRRRTP